MIFKYKPSKVCSQEIIIDISENGIINNVSFSGGCHGNLQGISAMVKGLFADEVISKLEGIDCRGRGTSCPDQLAKALTEAKEKIS